MNLFTRRLVTFLLCCWLPLPGLALAMAECHLLGLAMAHHEPSSSQQTPAQKHHESAGAHSGCGTAEVSQSAQAQTPCNHCQMACHHAQLLLISSQFAGLSPEPHPTPDYAIPLPQVVFINSPQRPPQAV